MLARIASIAVALSSCAPSLDDNRRPTLQYIGTSIGRPASALDFGSEKYRNNTMFVYRVDPGDFFPSSGDRHDFAAIVRLCGRTDIAGQEVPIFADGRPMRSYSGQDGAQNIEIYIDKNMHTYSAADENLVQPISFSEVAAGEDVCVALKWGGRVSQPAVVRPW